MSFICLCSNKTVIQTIFNSLFHRFSFENVRVDQIVKLEKDLRESNNRVENERREIQRINELLNYKDKEVRRKQQYNSVLSQLFFVLKTSNVYSCCNFLFNISVYNVLFSLFIILNLVIIISLLFSLQYSLSTISFDFKAFFLFFLYFSLSLFSVFHFQIDTIRSDFRATIEQIETLSSDGHNLKRRSSCCISEFEGSKARRQRGRLANEVLRIIIIVDTIRMLLFYNDSSKFLFVSSFNSQ